MVANIIIVVLVLSVFYAYANHNREFSATASAIQQIWSGTCRVACRQDESRRLSTWLDQENVVNPGSSYHEVAVTAAGTTSICICETCPCPLIDRLLKICNPVVNIYSSCIEKVSNCYFDIIKTLSDLYMYLKQVMNCGESCQRPPQVHIEMTSVSKDVPNQQLKDEVKKTKSLLNLKPSTSISFRKKTDNNLKNEASTSKAQNLTVEIESLRTIESSKSCSRCTEKGVICVDKCPRAKEKHE